jgi:hypothetical protein
MHHLGCLDVRNLELKRSETDDEKCEFDYGVITTLMNMKVYDVKMIMMGV